MFGAFRKTTEEELTEQAQQQKDKEQKAQEEQNKADEAARKKGAQSNQLDAKLSELKKQHPERVVEGIYYDNDEDLEKAKAALKEKKAKALEEARKTVKEREAKRAEAAQKINEALYGPGRDATQEEMRVTVGGIEMDAVLGNAELVQQRQHLLDPTDYENDIKKPNPGKFPNNEDAYPVDLKIEELEVHKPDVKIHEVTTHIHGKDAAMAAMYVGDAAEKRLIHLENIVATLMRYVFRLGSRVHINCVYYGGQTTLEKYKCIRCMHDDRISDGQMVQIDQCMNCIRYEPVYGQIYEIMNDLGANTAAILDDNQMGYADMEDYADLARTERFMTAKERGEYDLMGVLTRESTDVDFKENWGEGIKMNWEPVAKEDQKCHINWRQSINDDGSGLQRLASFPKDEINVGSNLTLKPKDAEIFEKEIIAMEQNKNDDLVPLITKGKSYGGNKDVIITEIKNGLADKIKQEIGSQQIDSLVIACLYYLTKKDISTLIKEYANMLGSLGTKNVGLIVSGMFCGQNAIKGSKPDDIHPIEEVGICAGNSNSSSKSSNSNSNNTKSHYDSEVKDLLKLDKSKIDSWLWVDYAPALLINAKRNGKSSEEVGMFCAVCYLYKELQQFVRGSRYDSEQYAFPYTEEELKACNGVQYSGWFNEPRSGHTHKGVDLATGAGNLVAIHAIHDGVVTAAGDGWGSACNAVNIDHGDGTYARYLHCSSINVTKGQNVSKGDIIAKTGGTGISGPNTYPIHLHLEFGHGNSESAISDTDPMTLFNETVGATHQSTFMADRIE